MWPWPPASRAALTTSASDGVRSRRRPANQGPPTGGRFNRLDVKSLPATSGKQLTDPKERSPDRAERCRDRLEDHLVSRLRAPAATRGYTGCCGPPVRRKVRRP